MTFFIDMSITSDILFENTLTACLTIEYNFSWDLLDQVNNGNTKTIFEICSKLQIKASEHLNVSWDHNILTQNDNPSSPDFIGKSLEI